MADLNPEVFEDLQVAERSRPLFEAAGLRLRTWEAYCLAFNERSLLRREISRIREGRGAPEIHPEVVERLQAIRTELDAMVGQLRKFLPPTPENSDARERQEMVLGFIAVSPTARDIAAKWIADPNRFRQEATQKLELIESVVERYRRALRAEIDAQMTSTFETPPRRNVPIEEADGPVPTTRAAALGAPPNLEALAGNGEVTLHWSAVPGAARYAVKRAAPDAPFAVIARPAQDSHADTDLRNGTTYRYVVVAVDAAGLEGAPSPVAAATPIAPPAAPAAPTVAPGNARATISWPPTPGATQYRLLRATNPAGPFSPLAFGDGTSFTDAGVANGTTYYYVISAANAAGESPCSPPGAGMPVAPPPMPAGLSALPGNARVSLSWTATPGATSYAVHRATDPEEPFVVVAGPSTPSCVDTGVANGTTYLYAISAINDGGQSDPCAAVAATPLAPPAAPAKLSAAGGNGEILLRWNAVSGAVLYVVRRAPGADGPWSVIAQPVGPEYTDTGLANGTAVFYSVAARNPGGESPACEPVFAVPVAPPPSPGKLAAAAGNGKLTLTWNPSPGAAGYVLRRATVPGGPYEVVASLEGTAHTDHLLSNDSIYYYRVSAKNGGGESAPSPELGVAPVGPPAAPSDLEAVAGNGRVLLRWRPVVNADHYRVMRSATPGGPYTALANPAETTYADTTAGNGETYYYIVRAVNDGGKGPYSAEVAASPQSAPAAPAMPSAVPGNGSVSLSWPDVPGAATYWVRRATAPEGPFAPIASTALPSAVDTDVSNGTTYYYAVTALNAAGESAPSPVAAAVPLVPPAVPTGLAATAGNGQVALAWTASARATAYLVRRGTSSAGPHEPVGLVTTAVYTDTEVVNETTYHYVVSARNEGGESAPSSAVSATPQAPPPAPLGLQAAAVGGRLSLAWSPAPRAVSYAVRRSTVSGGPYATIASPLAPSHVDADIAPGTAYFYVVTALNAGGESAPSAEASVRPVDAPGPVAAVHATAGNGQVSLAWPAVEGATGYVVKRSLFVQGPFAPIATVPGCAHLDAGLTNGTPVHYVVSAANAGGEAADSPPVTTTPVAPPAAPSGLSAAPAHHEVKLTWVASPRASNYVVRRSETPGGPYAAVATAVGPAHTDGPLENGRSYYYVVTAVNAGGESAPSDEVAATPIEPPAAPAGFAATSGNNQVLLAWAAVPGASYYQIKRALDKRGPYTTLANVSRVNYVDNSVENGTTYYYVVHSVNAGGRSAHSARVSALPVPPPPAPGHVVAIAGNFRVSLTWEPVATATGYSVKRSTQPGGPYATVARVPQTSFVDAAVANATTYYYVVRSGTGVVKGPFSAEVQATPMSTPAAPSGLTARPGLGTVSLSWAPSPGASCYRVKRADSERGPFEIVGSPEGTTWEDIGLAHGTTFYYRVSAESPGGESADSPAVGAAAVAPPGVPTKLEALPANGEVTLAWAPVAGTSRYRVKRASNPEGPWKIIAEPTQPRHLDPGLKNGTTYHYVVSAMNAHGESLDSFPAPATPVEPPALPTGLIAIPGHAKIDLAWTPVPTAARYRVQRSAAAGGPYVLVASPRDASYTDCPLTNGIPQFYVVSAVNAGGESPTCLEVSTAPISSVGEEKAARPAPPPPKKADDDVPTLESIPMPSAQQIQGIDFERLLDLRRVEQLRALFEDTAQTFDDWEILTLIAEDGYEIRKSVETLLRLKNQGDEDVFLSGAMALFDKILKIRAQYASFVRKLRELLTNLDVPAPSRDVLEIAIGFILQASRGRTRAEQWVADPVAHRKAAGEYMKMAYAIARKYRDAL